MNLLPRINKFLTDTNTPETRFGRDTVKDPRLVRDIRNGRELRPATADRIAVYLAQQGF